MFELNKLVKYCQKQKNNTLVHVHYSRVSGQSSHAIGTVI